MYSQGHSVSPTKAASLVGVARSTIYADMVSGKLSYKQVNKNKRSIEIVELERVYGSLKLSEADTRTDTRTDTSRQPQTALQTELDTLKLKLEHTQELLAIEKERREQAEILLKQLMPPKEPEKRKGFWARLFGG